jgi:hypothetical protein
MQSLIEQYFRNCHAPGIWDLKTNVSNLYKKCCNFNNFDLISAKLFQRFGLNFQNYCSMILKALDFKSAKESFLDVSRN